MEYILVPDYFSEETVDSRILRDFLREAPIRDYKISLNNLRKYYSKFPNKGIVLIEELRLRGFIFMLLNENKLLYNLNVPEEIVVVLSKDNSGKHLSLNKNLLGLSGFLSHIQSDFFFNGIPIYTFKNYITNYNLDLVKTEFLRHGFDVVDAKKFTNRSLPISMSTQVEPITNIKKQQIMANLKYIYGSKLNEMKIDTIFEGGAYNIARNYCEKNNLKTLADLEDKDLRLIESSRGMGIKKLNDMYDRLVQILLYDNRKQGNYEEDLVLQFKEDSYLLNKLYKQVKLDDLLTDGLLSNIREHLKKENIETLYDYIKYDNTNKKIMAIRGVGKRKLDAFNTIIKDELQRIYAILDQINEESFFIEGDYYNKVKDSKIKDIYHIVFNVNLGNKKKDSWVNDTISQYTGMKYKDIGELELIRALTCISSSLKGLDTLDNVVNKSISLLKERDRRVLIDRLKFKKTLDGIGQELGLTRERVRQIEANAKKKFCSNLKKHQFGTILKLKFIRDGYFSLEDVKNLITIENNFILDFLKENIFDGFYYYAEISRVYFKDMTSAVNDLNYLIAELPECGLMVDSLDIFLDLLSDNFINLSIEEIHNMFEYHQIAISGDYYSKSGFTDSIILDLIFQHIITKPFKVDENSIDIIEKYYLDHFNKPTEKDARNWDASIRRNNEIILYEGNTFIHINNVSVNMELINQIKEKIDKSIDETNYAHAQEVFDNLTKTEKDQIKTKQQLYSLIKYYYPEDYNYSHGNTLRIGSRGIGRKTNGELVKEILRKNGGSIYVNEILKQMGWEKYKLNTAIMTMDEIILKGNKLMFFEDLFENDELQRLRKLTSKSMVKGYTTIDLIYNKLVYDEQLNVFLKRNKIKGKTQLTPIIKRLDPQIKGHTKFLHYENSKIQSIEDLVYHTFKGLVFREEIAKLIDKIGYDAQQIGISIENLMKNKYYVQIEVDAYLPYQEFIVSEEIKSEIIEIADEEYKKRGYFIPIQNINKIQNVIDFYGYRWNQYILSNILLGLGYRKLERAYTNYKTEIIVLVKNEGKHRNFDELIFDLLRNLYKGIYHEEHIFKYLSHLGFYEVHEDLELNTLPLELKNSKLFSVDIIGNVRLAEL